MHTEGVEIHFEKNENKIIIQLLEKEHYHIKAFVAVSKDSVENEYFADIPALNLHVSSLKSKEQLQKNIHDAIESFFNFRLKLQGKDQFLMTMLGLGFSIKEKLKNTTPELSSKAKKSVLHKQSLELA